MTTVSNSNFLRHPLFLGTSAGFLLSVVIAFFCPVSDMKPEDSRVSMAFLGALFLVPMSLATVYAARSAFRSIRQMPALRLVWLSSAIFFTLAIAIHARFEWSQSRQFIREGGSVKGKVMETHPEDHNTLIVAYTISGVDYQSRATGPRDARSYKRGDSIQVYYLASRPGQGFCREPRWRPDLILFSWIVAAGILPLWEIGFLGAFVLRKQRMSAQ